MVVLGIDFGKRHLGLALSQGFLGEPLLVIDNSKDVFKKLDHLSQKHGVEKIVLGLPEGVLEREVRNFSKELKKRLKLPVVHVSEVYTSREAQEKLIATGAKRKHRRDMIHAAAAALILESFLERK